jgi:hypothetical protein
MAYDGYIFIAFRQDAGTKARVRVAINDRLYWFVADGAKRIEHKLSVMLGIAGVKCDEAFIGIDDTHRSESVAAERPYSLNGLLDRWLGPGDLSDSVKELLPGDCSIWSRRHLNGCAHVGTYL